MGSNDTGSVRVSSLIFKLEAERAAIAAGKAANIVTATAPFMMIVL
jgi:hypothetical protein